MSSASPPVAYGYLTPAEVRFLDAAVARLIPTDELGPGAREAGVTAFIDGQLRGVWGTHGRAYRMGPFLEGTPQQGYQLPLTPQEIYRAAIRETDAHCQTRYGKVFAFLSTETQDILLTEIEEGRIGLATAPAKEFFKLLLKNTVEGFFSDPIHGGNRDKIGWKLIGFPGVAATEYREAMTRHGEPYRVEPVSILDIVNGGAKVGPEGYPRHIMLNKA